MTHHGTLPPAGAGCCPACWFRYVYRPRGAGMLTTPRLIVIALCAALNFSIGTIVYLVKLPIYLDSIGTILCALLLASDRKVAFVCAWLAATVSTIISVLINPFIPWFALTDMTIALVSAFRSEEYTSE